MVCQKFRPDFFFLVHPYPPRPAVLLAHTTLFVVPNIWDLEPAAGLLDASEGMWDGGGGVGDSIHFFAPTLLLQNTKHPREDYRLHLGPPELWGRLMESNISKH